MADGAVAGQNYNRSLLVRGLESTEADVTPA